MDRYVRVFNIVNSGATWGCHVRRYDLIRVLDTCNERSFNVSNWNRLQYLSRIQCDILRATVLAIGKRLWR